MVKLLLGKKGFFFTIIAILFLFLLVIINQITLVQNESLFEQSSFTQAQNSNLFVRDVNELYLPTTLQRITIRAIEGYIDADTVVPLENFSTMFYELFKNGEYTYNGSRIETNETLQSALINLSDILYDELQYNVSIDFASNYITLYQKTPTILQIEMLFYYNVTGSEYQWVNHTEFVTAEIPIEGFADPLYQFHGSSFIPNISVSDERYWNIAKLKNHIQEYEYIQSNTAPSFLLRLANMTNASEYGILSFIDPVTVSGGTNEENRSYVDFQYWQTWDCEPVLNTLYEIDNISDDSDLEYFRIPFYYVRDYVNHTRRSAELNDSEFGSNITRICWE